MTNDNTMNFEARTVIFREGDDADKLYIVKRGEVLCLKSSKERLIPIFMAKSQDIIGESAMLADAPHTYSTIALTPVELIAIDNASFRDVLNEAPQWLVDLTITMVARYQSTAGLIAENRILDESILSEEEFSSSLEIDLKKLLNQ